MSTLESKKVVGDMSNGHLQHFCVLVLSDVKNK